MNKRDSTSELIPTEIVPSVTCSPQSPAQVSHEFKGLLASGAKLHAVGSARRNPERILEAGYTPKHRFDLLGTRFYLSNVRQNPELRFYIAFVIPPYSAAQKCQIYARIFYKDLSLVWRAASHMAYDTDGSLWIGKGDVRTLVEDGEEMLESVESTTDLPFEIQDALERTLKALRRVPPDDEILELVLRRSSADQIEPYEDFTTPRDLAAQNPKNLIHRGRSIARFTRSGDPTSLRFARGFEPDFREGVLESTTSPSRLYGGLLRRFRILSVNKKVQYLFIAGPEQVWIIPPQATTTELSSFGVRTIDVIADDDISLSGWEYHYLDSDLDPPEIYSQIPAGFAGRACPADAQKADASPWLDKMPVIKDFRRIVLGKKKTTTTRKQRG